MTIKEERNRNMSTLNVPGAKLNYEVSGHGPLLILIPGAAGTGEVFRPLIGPLAERYQVVTYDRRGFSRSELDGPQDYDHRLDTDAEDVRRLIEQLTDKRSTPQSGSVDKPAIVFGNSSGATVALEVLIRYPQWVDTAPLTSRRRVDSRRQRWIAYWTKADGNSMKSYRTYRVSQRLAVE